MHLDCLLRLNLANQSRIEFFRNRIEIKLAKAKERKMILEGRLNMPSSNRKLKYEKPVLLHHFKNGSFCDGLGHVPVEVADAGCTKLSALKLGCLRFITLFMINFQKLIDTLFQAISSRGIRTTKEMVEKRRKRFMGRCYAM